MTTTGETSRMSGNKTTNKRGDLSSDFKTRDSFVDLELQSCSRLVETNDKFWNYTVILIVKCFRAATATSSAKCDVVR